LRRHRTSDPTTSFPHSTERQLTNDEPDLVSRPQQLNESTPYSTRRDWSPLLTLYVALAGGGALGTVGRYTVSGWVVHWWGPTPLGTFAVNIVGSLLIGFILVFTQERVLISSNVRLFLATGFLGGFTTFSAFVFETMGLVEDHSLASAALNIGGSLISGLIAVWLGMTIARVL
jgi:CrcB protein